MRTKTELSSGEWAVLALLCERPRHGYAVAAAMAPDGEIGEIWSVTRPLVYRAINVLREQELVRVTGVRPGDRAPRRTELVATSEARRMVRRWLDEPVRRPRDLRSGLLLKISFLYRRRHPLAPLLTAQRAVLVERVAELTRQLAGEREPSAAFSVRWRLISAEAGLRFVDETLASEPVASA